MRFIIFVIKFLYSSDIMSGQECKYFKNLCLGSVHFTINGKSSAGTILPFELYPALSTYNVDFVTLATQSM